MFNYINKLVLSLLLFSNIVLAEDNSVLDFQYWQTINGAEVYFMPAPELPMVDVIMQFKAGSAYDNDKLGSASFTASMLNKGTSSLDEEAIAERFDKMGAQFSAGVSKDSTTISLRSLSESALFTDAVKLFAAILADPLFPQDGFERDQQRAIIALRQQEQLPAYIAEQTFYKNLYNQHPYANPITGTSASVELLTQNDIHNFYQKHYVADNAIVTIVGDITVETAEKIAEQITVGLPNTKAYISLPPVEPIIEGINQHVEFPSEQTHVWLGTLGIDKLDPRFFPLLVGNYMLGGQPLVAKLFEEVREKRGLAYSVRSRLVPMLEPGPFLVNLQTRNDQTEQALEVIKQTITDFLSEGFPEQQLEKAKTGLIGAFPLNFSGNSAIAAQLANIGFYGLPHDYLDTYRDNISAVSNQDIIDAFNELLDMDNLIVVTVGENE